MRYYRLEKFFLYLCLFTPWVSNYGQTVRGKLQFKEGQKLSVQVDFKNVVIQQAMGKAIDFTTEGSAVHHYKVMSTDDKNTTLLHENKSLSFEFDGMGQKHSFQSEKQDHKISQFTGYVKNILDKKYELVIDESGNVLLAKPAKIETVVPDEKITMVAGMLRNIIITTYPPKKGDPGFFKILPAKEISLNESWTDSIKNEAGNLTTTYTLSGITDTTTVISFTSTGYSISKTMMMGREAITRMNNNSTGNIILDRSTGILLRKMIATESNGIMEAMGGSTPVTERSTITIQVKSD